jgi:DNA transformation protein
MTPIERLMNLGPVTGARLREVGIETVEVLREVGSVAAFVRLRFARGRSISRNALHAMEAGLLGIPWQDLPADVKARLDADVMAAEQRRPRELAESPSRARRRS